MKNWKTTLAGLLAALGVACEGSDNATLKAAGSLIGALGALLLGALSKDHNVTGGNTQQ